MRRIVYLALGFAAACGLSLYSDRWEIRLIGTGLVLLLGILAERKPGAALRLLAAFLPASCLCAVMTGYLTAENRIGTLAAVEVCEQLCSMGLTLLALKYWAGHDAGRACQCVIFGSFSSGCLTLCTLVVLRNREHPQTGAPFPIGRRLIQTAVPLGLADVLKKVIQKFNRKF